jgi:RHS repeat-associated protein
VTCTADGSTLTYGYDKANRLRTIADSVSGTITLTPDDFDRLQTAQTAQGTVSYTYDTSSFRRTLQIAGQSSGFVYTPDNANRLAQITLGSETVQIGYDNASRRATLTLPNNMQTLYGFDAADRLTNLTYKNGAGTTLGTLIYGYDNASHITSQTGTWAYNQLPPATTSDYQYDAGDRLNAGNGYAPVYDNQGQMKQDGKGNTYTWNARHQLVEIDNGPTVVAQFRYDGLGRRYQKTIGTTTTTYLYDGITPIQEKQGSTVNNLLTGWGVDEIFARTDAPGRMYYLRDAIGSTVGLAASSGIGKAIVKQQYAYDPYGNATKLKAATVNNPYTYTGREDDGTGLYYYRARYYSPSLGRFIAEDPIGLAGGPNPYAYVQGNPISQSDPLGLFGTPFDVGAGAVAGAIGGYVADGPRGAVIGAIGGAVVGFASPFESEAAGATAASIFRDQFLNGVTENITGQLLGSSESGKSISDSISSVDVPLAAASGLGGALGLTGAEGLDGLSALTAEALGGLVGGATERDYEYYLPQGY